MNVLIVAKTRMGTGACIGAITKRGESVRLLAADAEVNERFNLEYEIGDVWELLDCSPPEAIIPPHTEDLVVWSKRRLRTSNKLLAAIRRFMPPACGGLDVLYGGMLQLSNSGRVYVGQDAIPKTSTLFWQPDRPLHFLISSRGHFRYAYPGDEGGRYLTYVGFQPPVETLPAGILLRVSLARWWQPRDHPEEEPRCYAQISGWFEDEPIDMPLTPAVTLGLPRHTTLPRVQVDMHALLHRHFGFRNFRPQQQEIIEAILARQDALVVMATGAGKSLCYQLPALAFEGLTLVVSPLISLMEDQVAHLHHWGIAAAGLHSLLSGQEYNSVVRAAQTGALKLLYLAPETLLRPHILNLLDQLNVECLVVDEAHCISEWGHDFRPEYRDLIQVRSQFPHIPCVAMTATATPAVRDDIAAALGIGAGSRFVGAFDRPNLYIAVQERGAGVRQVLDFLQAHREQSGIIYCNTRRQVDELTADLQAAGVDALGYHGGMGDAQRAEHQRRFTRDTVRVMVATVAFGMGIDKPDVRFVLHYNMPKNLETYFQQIGRAGRDGGPADCLMLYTRQDFVTARGLIDLSDSSETHRRQQHVLLQQMVDWTLSPTCRHGRLLTYFGQDAPQMSCDMCDNCRTPRQEEQPDDLTEVARLFLECCRDTREMFGAGHLINILRGSRAQSVLRWQHDQLTYYGAGRSLSTARWQDLVTQFRQQQLVALTQHGGLYLTEQGRAVLNGASVWGRLQAMPRAAEAYATPSPHDYDEELFARLRELRRQMAENERIPPYIIFGDRSLQEMATYYPLSKESFAAIYGIGEYKLTHYAARCIEVIQAYCAEHGLAERPRPERTDAPARDQAGPNRTRRGRILYAVQQLERGRTVNEIADELGLRLTTIVGYLERYIGTDRPLSIASLMKTSVLSAAEQAEVFAQFDRLGIERLSPIFEALDGRVSYLELRLLRLCYRLRMTT
ncbi:MAG: DNA helicase RecQ [Caldilineaceae bacterium]|nr:DNA helicase RecQ [Caldilineaceae bacterium]